MSKKIMIFAGEASGDLQGAHLADTLKEMNPSYTLRGVGGPKMKEKGVDVIYDSSTWGIIGPWHALKKIPFLMNLVNELKRIILKDRPDLIILIDSPAVNMRLARFAKENGIKSLYFFPPSAWYPSIERARKIADSVDYIVPAFSYTVQTYERAGIPFSYFGHPIVDMVNVNSSREELLQRFGLSGDREYIGIMPGSREQEITSLMPVLVKSMKMIKKQRKSAYFLLPVAAPMLRLLIEKYLNNECDVKMIDGCAHEVMKMSRLIIMASGTASVEAAMYGTPMIILYKLAWPDWCIGKIFIKVPFISLPNLILQERVVPELIQLEVNPARIFSEATELLDDTKTRKKMIDDLLLVKGKLGDPGVMKKVGNYIVELCNGNSREFNN